LIVVQLLGGKVKVESSLESVEVKLTGREKSSGGGGSGGEGELVDGRLDGLLGSTDRLLYTSQVTGKQTSVLVGGVEWVDEGVDTRAVSTGRHAGELGSDGVVGGKLGSVSVELEVSVGGVVGVDEGVEVGVDGGIGVVIVRDSLEGGLDGGSSHGGGLESRSSSGSGSGGSRVLRVEGSRVEAVGAGRDVVTLQDSESVLAGGVLDSDGLAVVTNIAVLTDTFSIQAGFFSEHNTVLLGESRAESAVASVESLLLEDLGVLGVDELGSSQGGKTRG